MNKLPEDFDWEYYTNTHPDLQKANINTEYLAIYHYVTYGHKENRKYKPDTSGVIIENIINQQNKKT